jgi:hypothetical protein
LSSQTVANTEGMRLWQSDADTPLWESADLIVQATIVLASQDSTGITDTVATDREICTWHGLVY